MSEGNTNKRDFLAVSSLSQKSIMVHFRIELKHLDDLFLLSALSQLLSFQTAERTSSTGCMSACSAP